MKFNVFFLILGHEMPLWCPGIDALLNRIIGMYDANDE
jgi:hypothetical protein